MPFLVNGTLDANANPMTVAQLCAALIANPGFVPTFAMVQGPSISLTTSQYGIINPQTPFVVLRSIGLISCASFVFQTANGATAFVLHNNVGLITQAEFNLAMQFLANPPLGTVFVAYAHPNPQDAGYLESGQLLVNWGVNPNQIVEIQNLALSNFGATQMMALTF